LSLPGIFIRNPKHHPLTHFHIVSGGTFFEKTWIHQKLTILMLAFHLTFLQRGCSMSKVRVPGVLFAAVFAAVALVGCGDNNNGTGLSRDSALSGTAWSAGIIGSDDYETITFGDDGTALIETVEIEEGESEPAGRFIKANWNTGDNKLILTNVATSYDGVTYTSSEVSSLSVTYKVEGGRLILTDSEGNSQEYIKMGA
jgi:hypothetical protein